MPIGAPIRGRDGRGHAPFDLVQGLADRRAWLHRPPNIPRGRAMSHGVHAVQHEAEHKIKHDEHGGGGHDSQNKKIALVIAVLALFLAFSETLGKSSQTSALNFQIEASNLWNFFQAKNIRRTATIVAAESAKIDLAA